MSKENPEFYGIISVVVIIVVGVVVSVVKSDWFNGAMTMTADGVGTLFFEFFVVAIVVGFSFYIWNYIGR